MRKGSQKGSLKGKIETTKEPKVDLLFVAKNLWNAMCEYEAI